VLRMLDGSTVEVIDTDAEGRLALADALSWTRQQHPRVMVDVATLTGSIITALGAGRAGLFDNDAALAAELAAAGEVVGERLWRMPIGERHRADLESDIADIKQCASGRLQPDACHAAAFLREFAGTAAGTADSPAHIPWAHLDIAGKEWREAADDTHPAGATGYGVRLLDTLMRQHFETEPA